MQTAERWRHLALASDELGFKRQAVYCWTKVRARRDLLKACVRLAPR